MKWNKQRIVAVGVLALAGGAFGVDRFVLGYGSSTVPPVETTAQIMASAPMTAAAPPADIVRTVTLSQRVGRISAQAAAEGRALDALTVPVSWIPRIAPPPPPTIEQVVKPVVQNPKLVLTSIFNTSDPTKASARLNGKLVKAGEMIEGCTLMGVWQSPDRSYVAVLSGPGGGMRVPLTQAPDNTRTDLADSSDATTTPPK